MSQSGYILVINTSELDSILKRYCDKHGLVHSPAWTAAICQFYINYALESQRGNTIGIKGLTALIFRYYSKPFHIVFIMRQLERYVGRRVVSFPFRDWHIITHPDYRSEIWVTNEGALYATEEELVTLRAPARGAV